MPVRRPLAFALLTVSSIFAAAAAAAEDKPASPPRQEEAKKQEKIEVEAGGATDERRASTAAKIVVNHDELVEYGDTTLLDAVKRLPGITVQGNSIRMRGMAGGYTQILVDGDPVPPGFSIETLSPDLIERIEIYRSPTAEFSTQSIAGTINIVLRKAVSHRRRELKASISTVNGAPSGYITGQTADRSGALTYTLPFSVNVFDYRWRWNAQQLGWDAAGVPNLDYTTGDVGHGHGFGAGLTPKLSWAWGKDHTLLWESFANVNHFQNIFEERSDSLLGAPPPYPNSTTAYGATAGSGRTSLQWNRRLADDARIEVKAGLNYNHRSSLAVFDAYDTQDIYLVHRTVDGRATDEGATLKGKYVFPFVPGHAFVAGWDGEYSRRVESRVQSDFAPTGGPVFDIDEHYDARVARLAAFAQDEWEATSRLSAYFGLRWEGIETRSVGNTVETIDNRSGVWSPIVQALWKLPDTEKDQVRVGLARTYRAPSTFEIIPRRYIANNNTATTPDSQGNPDLKPELAWGLDLAYEHYFTGGGVFSASVYERRIDDVILRELLDVNGTFISRPANEGHATVKGIELDTKFALTKLFPSAPAIDLRANVSRHWSHVEELPGPDNRLAQQNRWSGNVGFDWKAASAPLTTGLNFGFYTGGPVRLSFTQATYTTARRTLDAYALWKFSPNVQLRFFANNLLRQDNVRIDRYDAGNGALELTAINPTYRTFGLSVEMKE